jgi:tetratricopeptide (TPR) repeat protein
MMKIPLMLPATWAVPILAVMAASATGASSKMIKSMRMIFNLKLSFRCSLIAPLLAAFMIGASAATETRLVFGTVHDARGLPVSEAWVQIETPERTLAQTSTDHDGSFTLRVGSAGKLLLRVRKNGFQEKTLPLTDDSFLKVQIVLSPEESRANSMQFSDQPSFSVSGITDWTAAGGHGSDANLRASEALARDARMLGDDAKRGSLRMSVSDLKATLAREPDSFSNNRRLGQFYLGVHRFQDAIGPLSKAFQLEPGNYENSYELAQAYEGAGEHDRAKQLAFQLLSSADRPELHRLLGDIEEASNQPLAAEREYERALRLDPSEENYFALASELLVHRAVEPAIEIFGKGALAYPRSERMLAGWGAALYANGQYVLAAQRVCDASDLNPDDLNPYLFLGHMQQYSSEVLPCAEQKLARFVERHPHNPRASFYYAIALVKADASDHGGDPRVQVLLNNAVREDSKFAPAYLELGNLLSERGQVAEAVGLYQKSIAADPNLSEAHFRLAQAYRHAGENTKAAREFQIFDRLKRSEAASVEQHRREIRQFVVVLRDPAQATQ